MRTRLWLIGVVAVSLLYCTGSARATTLFSDDFESYSDVASSWMSDTDNDPNGAGWTVDESDQTRVQVMRSPVSSSGYKFDTPYGSQYLHMWRDGSGSSAPWANLNSAAQTQIAANGNMRVEIDARNVSGLDGWGGNIGIAAFDSAPGVYSGRAFSVALRPDGALWLYQGATTTKLAGAYTLNAWNRFAVDVDFITDRWSVAVNGSTVASDLVFEGGDLSKVQNISLSAWDYSGTAGRGGFDNLLVTTPIPEPGTLVTLGVGLIGLLAYAWRKRK